MGEEKPDEELMGKRKPAPRLSTTFCDVDSYMMSGIEWFYTWCLIIFLLYSKRTPIDKLFI
ncbi:hypothetical protein M2105_000091 [Paenibacillus sp. PastF-1]|nr:hypothetical protein [Paenibacillus sp. PastF-2]MDF9845677.1 hypothetical protein [Paenibacillus sp. PastM-2]MDF9852249.1 hypothetical protein [Paenibacillus sp. PastF-1]MDH6478022.1 hypothetical protein [Paenibacillus sp. PastH-2]MDH6505757.1 hypothetical protein [Paenibacillus sp. PastM-3]